MLAGVCSNGNPAQYCRNPHTFHFEKPFGIFTIKSNIYSVHEPGIPVLGVHRREMKIRVHKNQNNNRVGRKSAALRSPWPSTVRAIAIRWRGRPAWCTRSAEPDASMRSDVPQRGCSPGHKVDPNQHDLKRNSVSFH